MLIIDAPLPALRRYAQLSVQPALLLVAALARQIRRRRLCAGFSRRRLAAGTAAPASNRRRSGRHHLFARHDAGVERKACREARRASGLHTCVAVSAARTTHAAKVAVARHLATCPPALGRRVRLWHVSHLCWLRSVEQVPADASARAACQQEHQQAGAAPAVGLGAVQSGYRQRVWLRVPAHHARQALLPPHCRHGADKGDVPNSRRGYRVHAAEERQGLGGAHNNTFG